MADQDWLQVLSLGAESAMPGTEGVAAGWFARQGCVAALVRPDHYVDGCAQTAQDVAALVAQAQEALGLAEVAAG